MMYSIRPSTRFQKDLKRVQKRGYDIALLTEVIQKSSKNWLLEKSCHPRIVTISLLVIIAAVGSVILLRTGCWCMRLTAQN